MTEKNTYTISSLWNKIKNIISQDKEKELELYFQELNEKYKNNVAILTPDGKLVLAEGAVINPTIELTPEVEELCRKAVELNNPTYVSQGEAPHWLESSLIKETTPKVDKPSKKSSNDFSL